MKTIHKYEVMPGNTFTAEMPSDSEFLHLEWCPWLDKPFMWWLVNTNMPMITRTFATHPTGIELPKETRWYNHLGSFLVQPEHLVFHVFEINGPEPAGER